MDIHRAFVFDPPRNQLLRPVSAAAARDGQRRARQDGWPQAESDFRRAPRVACAAGPEKDFTIRGLVSEFAERGLKVDYRSVWNFVHAEKLSFECVVASERDRPDIA